MPTPKNGQTQSSNLLTFVDKFLSVGLALKVLMQIDNLIPQRREERMQEKVDKY